jgi:hypothetical protein
MSVKEKLAEGTMITATMDTGTIQGEVVGIASELGPLGYVYIIKLTNRCGKTWEKHPYSCVPMPRSLFQLADTQPWREAKKIPENMRPVPCPRCGCPIFREVNRRGRLPKCKNCGYQDLHK